MMTMATMMTKMATKFAADFVPTFVGDYKCRKRKSTKNQSLLWKQAIDKLKKFSDLEQTQ
jgi:hypothetical protein